MNILPPGCREQLCEGIPADSQSYSLQDALYFNGTPITAIVVCPTGRVCAPGSFPPTITYPPGTFVIPNVPFVPGQPIVLSLQGCQSLISITLPAIATAAEIKAAADSIIAQAAAQQAQCDAFPTFPFGATIELSDLEPFACLARPYEQGILAISAPGSYPISFNITSGSLPPGITLSSTDADEAFFTGTPTTPGAYTFTLTASSPNGASLARAYTITVIGITTTSPLPNGIPGDVYSETLTTSGMAGTLLWGVASGSLPDGLVLNSSTGEITGIPTTVGVSSFTIFVQNGTQQCMRALTMEVAASSCNIFSAITWGAPAITAVGGGSASGSASGNTASGTASAGLLALGIGEVVLTGTMPYTGDEISCDVTLGLTSLNSSSMCGGGSNCASASVKIESDIDGVLLLDSKSNCDGAGDGPGNYIFNFTIPASVGATITFTITFTTALPDCNGSGNVSGTATIGT